MSHLNYNHLYYFWMVCKQGSITKAAEALFLTPQTVTGQIKALEERMDGKLTKRNGRSVEQQSSVNWYLNTPIACLV